MQVIPIRTFPHDRRGTMQAGKVYTVDDAEAQRLLTLRLVRKASPDEHEAKAASGPLPSSADGEVPPSSASPAAQASPQTTAKPSARGGKKKAKKRAE